MRFKLDENLPAELTELFRQAGHEAVSVLDQGLGGAADPEIGVRFLRSLAAWPLDGRLWIVEESRIRMRE